MAAADDSAILEAREASIETRVSMPAAADDTELLLSDETWQKLVATFDANGDGALDLSEFSALVDALIEDAPSSTVTAEEIAGNPAFGPQRATVTASELRAAAVKGVFGDLSHVIPLLLRRILVAQPTPRPQQPPQQYPQSTSATRLPYGCAHHNIKSDLYHNRPVRIAIPPPTHVSQAARFEVIVDAGGISNVGRNLHIEQLAQSGRPCRIATMVAGNSGRPGGACGFEDGTVRALHPNHSTQEEDVISNWLATTCHAAGQPLTDAVADGAHPLANMLYQQTIAGQWGMSNPAGTDKFTIQHVDYTRARSASFYGDAWVVEDALLSSKRVAPPAQKSYGVTEAFPTSLVFVAGPNCGAWGRSDKSTTRRTYNRFAAEDYPLFRAGVEAALHAGLVAMARLGCDVALLAHVSAGIYAGEHKQALLADYECLVNDLLDTPVSTPSGPVPLGRYFQRVVLATAPSSKLAWLQRQLEAANALAARLEKQLALQSQQTHVPARDVVLQEQIGRGTFGVVHRARWQGADIAVKVVAADTSAAERKRAAGMLLEEAKALGRVRHPNVVQLLGVCTDSRSPMMLLSLAAGTLVDELDAAEASGVPMAVGRKLQLARDICAGMAALHARGILHLDLKPANVLISRAGEALVADFGLSIQLRTTLTGASLAASAVATAAGARGTMAYKAPELSRPRAKGGAVYAKPCDVYSFAMLLWELFAGGPPWAGMPEMEIQTAHVASFLGEAPMRPDLPTSAPAKALELMEGSWSQDPAARPTFEALSSELGALVAAHPIASDGAGSSAAAAAVASKALARRLAEGEAELAKLRAAAEHATAGKATLQTQLQITGDEVVALRHDCAAAKAELTRQQALLQRARVQFPPAWTSQSDDGGDRGSISWWRAGRCQVMVDSSSQEWAEVEGKLKESLPTAELVRLERVEDRLLWKDYCAKRDRIKLKRCGDANEQQMWHGTSALDPHKALEHEVGIDPRFSSAAFYGRGVYLAAKARYSNGDRDRSYVFYPDYPDLELRQLLLLRAAVGVSKDFGSLVSEVTRSLTKPPDQTPGVLFDSVQGGPHRPSRAGAGQFDSPIVILYDLAQAYPEYIVTYRVREKRGWFW